MGYLSELTDRHLNGEVSEKMYAKYVEMHIIALNFKSANSSTYKRLIIAFEACADAIGVAEKVREHKEKTRRASGLTLDGTSHGGSGEGLNRIPEPSPRFAIGGVIESDNDVIINQITNF